MDLEMNSRSSHEQVQLIWDPWNPHMKNLTQDWCRPQSVSYGCCVFKRHWWCSPTSRITLSKNAMSASLDEVRHITETAVHTHWCSFQQPTKWICIIVASISRINWVRHHLLQHRESHQAIIMEDLQRAPWLAEELMHWWTDRWHHTVFRNICLHNIQCAQNRLYRCSTVLVVLQERETRSNGPNKAKCPMPHTWAPCALRHGMETCGFRTAARTDNTESDTTRQLPRDGRMFMS